MELVRLFGIILLLFIGSIGCEVPATRKNLRSHHLPLFPQIDKDEESHSNPYWVRMTAIGDNQTMDLNDSSEFEPDSPSLVGTLGTHYRFPENWYAYIMTDGIGAQWDFYHWEGGKLATGAYVGINNTWGVQFMAAKEVAQAWGAPVTLFASVQLRQDDLLLECKANGSLECQGSSLLIENQVRFQNQVFDPLVGVEFGTFKLGSKGNTTMYVNLELGIRQVLHRFQTEEKFSPANYEQEDSQPLFSITVGGTLW